MPNRHTGIGAAFARSEKEGMELIAQVANATGGRVLRMAKVLGITRRWMYHLLDQHEAWASVNRARKRRARQESELLDRTGRALLGVVPRKTLGKRND